MRQLLVSSSPHIKTSESVPRIMWTVVVALVPAWLAGIYFYGPNALGLGLACIITSMAMEYAIVYIRTKPEPKGAVPRNDPFTLAATGKVSAEDVALSKGELDAKEDKGGFLSSHRHRHAWKTCTDGSAAVTGLLFAMILKPNTLYWVDSAGQVVSEWYVVVFGCFFAIGLTKHLFGGIGCNIWNPALAARAFVQISYGKEVNGKFAHPFGWIGDKSEQFFAQASQLSDEVPTAAEAASRGVDAITRSTPLEWYKQGKLVWSLAQDKLQAIVDAFPRGGIDGDSALVTMKQLPALTQEYFAANGDLGAAIETCKEAGTLGANVSLSSEQLSAASDVMYSSIWQNMLDMLPNHWLGGTAGSMGETAAILLLIGGVFLWAKGYLDWRVPIGFLAAVGLMSLVVPYKGAINGFEFLRTEHIWYKSAFHLGAGGLMLGAWFMATDMVSSPVSKSGNLIFGIGCGVLTVVIRNFAAYPEGVCYAILIMNTATPMIDRFTKPRVFGTKTGASKKESAKT